MKRLVIAALAVSAVLCGCSAKSAGNSLGTAVDRYDQYYTTNGYRYNDGYIYDNGYGYTNSSGTKYGDDSGFGGNNAGGTVSGGYIGRGISGTGMNGTNYGTGTGNYSAVTVTEPAAAR